MYKLIAVMLVLTLTGCARYNIEPPVTDYMSNFNTIALPKIEVGDIPKSPKIKKVIVDGVEYGALNLDGMNSVIQMRAQAKKNTEVLKEVLLANEQFMIERNSLLGLAQELEKRSNLLARQWANTEEQRRQAEDIHLIERSIYQVIIVLGLIAVAL